MNADFETMSFALINWLAERREPLWFVGGAVRDLCVGRPVRDVDLVVAGDALALANALVRALGGTVGVLDHAEPVVRVTVPALPFHLDFATLRGATIQDDLAARDFAVNAMALPCTPTAWVALLRGRLDEDQAVIDPFEGRADLAAQRLRLATPGALEADPLRILRAARIATALNLTFDPALIAAAHTAAPGLAAVAPERIAAELLVMVGAPQATAALKRLDELGGLVASVPPLGPCRGLTQGPLHHWDVFTHTLEVVDAIDHVVDLLELGLTNPPTPATVDPQAARVAHPTALHLGGHNQDLLDHLWQPLAAGHTRLTLLKLAAIFHDVGKPFTRAVDEHGKVRFPGHSEAGVAPTAATLQHWHLGRQATRYITGLVQHHMRPGQLAGPHGVSTRALRHYFRDAGESGLDIAVFSIADHFAVYGPDPFTPFWLAHLAAVNDLVWRFFETPDEVIPPRLIDGNDLQYHFGMLPGPAMRGVLEAVHTARLDGTIATRAEALALAAELLAAQPSSAPLSTHEIEVK